MKGRWHVDVLRAQLMYSFAHALAIIHVMTGRTKEWVATGSAKGKTAPLASSIIRMMSVYVGATQILIVVGLVYDTSVYGLSKFWVMWGFLALGLYIHIPVLFVSLREIRQRARAKTIPHSPRSTTLPADAGHSSIAVIESVPQRSTGPTQPDDDSQLITGEPSTGAAAQAPGPRRFRPDIQGLRAIAVTLVVLYHADLPGLTGGYVGVDVFFVISGFLISGQLVREVDRTGHVGFVHFYGGRVRRLLPPAALVLIVTVLASRLWGSIFQVKTIGIDAIYTALYAINYHLASQNIDYQNANGPVSPLQHFWSLAVEEQFYIVWPLLIVLCVLIARRYRWKLFGISLIGLTALSLTASMVITQSDPPYAYFSLATPRIGIVHRRSYCSARCKAVSNQRKNRIGGILDRRSCRSRICGCLQCVNSLSRISGIGSGVGNRGRYRLWLSGKQGRRRDDIGIPTDAGSWPSVVLLVSLALAAPHRRPGHGSTDLWVGSESRVMCTRSVACGCHLLPCRAATSTKSMAIELLAASGASNGRDCDRRELDRDCVDAVIAWLRSVGLDEAPYESQYCASEVRALESHDGKGCAQEPQTAPRPGFRRSAGLYGKRLPHGLYGHRPRLMRVRRSCWVSYSCAFWRFSCPAVATGF